MCVCIYIYIIYIHIYVYTCNLLGENSYFPFWNFLEVLFHFVFIHGWLNLQMSNLRITEG